jgi:hypothetical protein
MLLYDLADPQELTGYVRGALDEVNRNRFILSNVLPNENIDDIEWRADRGSLQDQDAASVRAWDTESGIASRQGISRIMGELPPISRKIPVTEEQRLRKRKLETGSAAQLVNKIFDDAANMARACAARVELFRGEALYTGAININENGFVASIPFGRDASMDPAALTGTALWSAPTTATPVANLRAWLKAYRDLNAVDPAAILLSQDAIDFLLLSSEIRGLFTTVSGIPSAVPPSQLQSVLNAYGIPPLVPYDVKVRVNGSQVRVIPNSKVIFVPPTSEPLGKTFCGTTAEALELAEARQISNDEVAGMVAVVEKTFDPVQTWTKAACIALPVLINPNLTLCATVL